jgi:hypothetical protein
MGFRSGKQVLIGLFGPVILLLNYAASGHLGNEHLRRHEQYFSGVLVLRLDGQFWIDGGKSGLAQTG